MIGLVENSGAKTHADPLEPRVEAIFRKGGHLQTALGLDHRPQQEAMALATARAIESDQPLLFEAGTGVGKSLAYLIPGLLHAIDAERPFLVSSHTISLQEQIRNKDLGICRQLFNSIPELQPYAGFKTALMVGRGNYCCTTRLNRVLQEAGAQEQTELFAEDEKAELMRIAEWANQTKDGLYQELSPAPPPEVWEAVNADSSVCSPKKCDPKTCFYQRARRQLLGANCVILNHSLLFSLINAGMPPEDEVRGILLPDDFAVLDEAHRIPAIATEHFGLHLSSFGVDRTLKRIYNPRKNRGVLGKFGQHWDKEAVARAIESSREFFGYLGDTFLSRKSIQRIHEPDFCENLLSGPLKEVAERLGAISQKIDDEHSQVELRDHRRRILACRDAINAFVAFSDEDHVQWLERGGRKETNIVLRSAPLDVASRLRETIFSRHSAAILTSATLSDGHNMEAFQKKVGAESAQASIEYSPFDYERNCRICLATDSPAPESDQGRLDLEYLADMICWCAGRTAGGTLVLFTSHADLQQAHRRCEPVLRKMNRPLFSQGHRHPRGELTRLFSEAGNGVLFGTDSFWTGVDIPGPALSQVILPRLPFDNPRHPVSEARNDAIRQNGGNPFSERIIPDALVKFRQGIGRLIRRSDDSGAIVILDSRILNKPYGRLFLAALPTKNHIRFSRTNRDSVFP